MEDCMDEQNILGLKDVMLDEIGPQTPDPEVRARKTWQARAKNGPFAVDPEVCDVWAGNTRDVAALTSASFFDLRESLRSVGQKIPIIARISSRDPERLEIVAGPCGLTQSGARTGTAADRSRGLDEERVGEDLGCDRLTSRQS
jgi:hypothetical protein